MSNAVVMLSGGQDSSTTLAIAAQENEKVTAISVNYGQGHSKELICAAYQAAKYADEYIVIDIDPKIFGDKPLLSGEGIPKEWSEKQGPAPTIVPGRNTILLAIGAAAAEARGYEKLYCGVSSVDYSGYPDCRPEFIRSLQEAVSISSQDKVQIVTPIMEMTKDRMIEVGTDLGVEWEHTWTCYRGQRLACGECPACNLRLEAFEKLDMTDPIAYKARIETI